MKSALIGEFLGTFLLVFFGCGSVCAALFFDAQVGVFQVAIVWGLGIAVAIHLTAAASGAHLNPAVTAAFALFRGFPGGRVPAYMLIQLAGAFAAAALLFTLFAGGIHDFEVTNGIVRGQPGSEASAMAFGEFYPNPGGEAIPPDAHLRLPMWRAMLVEVVGTGLLVLVIFGLTDPANSQRPKELTALLIGLTVTALISLLAPLTMGCFNPARDLGPRIFSSLAGWGHIPFTTNGWGWLTVYIVSPLIGGVVGGAVWSVIRPALFPPAEATVG